MAAESTFAPNWTKLIARSWVDPQFHAALAVDPTKILTQYGIAAVGGRSVAALEGKIRVVDQAATGQEKPFMDGDTLMIPLPAAPRDYDTVVDPESVAVAGGAVGTASGYPDFSFDIRSGTGGHGNTFVYERSQQSSTQQSQNSQSIPSLPSVPTNSGDEPEGEGAGEGAGEAAGEAGADAGADAAADAAASAAAFCP
jgi:hypothetical protein